MYADAIVNTFPSKPIDVTHYPVEMQSTIVAEEVRHTLLGVPGDILCFIKASMPFKPNKRLLLDTPIDYSQAIDYLKRGCEINPDFRMENNLDNLLRLMLPTISEVISRIAILFVLNERFESNGLSRNIINLKWGVSLRQLFI